MPNIKSAAKRDQLSKAKNAVNKANKTALKTKIKKFDALVQEDTAYSDTVKAVDQAVAKGLIHKNNAARKKSRLTKELNAKA